MNRWERALEGESQAVLIIGEAGIGKSRLAQQFHEQIAGAPHTWVEAALVVLDKGFAKNLSTTTLQKGVYAFVGVKAPLKECTVYHPTIIEKHDLRIQGSVPRRDGRTPPSAFAFTTQYRLCERSPADGQLQSPSVLSGLFSTHGARCRPMQLP